MQIASESQWISFNRSIFVLVSFTIKGHLPIQVTWPSPNSMQLDVYYFANEDNFVAQRVSISEVFQ